jgi:hypothetical protein
LDKSHRIISITVEVREETDADKVIKEIERKLVGKYCEKVVVHVR